MQKNSRFSIDLIFFSIIRTIMDTGQRMIISFLPIFARGLKVNLEEIALVISFRYLLGILSPYTGLFAENQGTKKGMILGILFFITGYGLFSIKPIYSLFFILLILATLGRMFFNPSMQAYIGDNSDKAQRGFAMSVPEIGWSIAAIIGVPLVGLMIEKFNWITPFPWFAFLGIAILIGIFFWLPSGEKISVNQLGLKKSLGKLLKNSTIVKVLGAILLLSTSQAVITIIYSTHMESSFDFQITALGIFSLILGVAELSGEGLSAFLSDRLKPGLAVCLGMGVHMIVAILMPIIGNSLPGAIIGLALIFLGSEFFVVGILPVLFNISTDNRITTLSLKMTVHHGGVALGIFLGPFLFRWGWNVNFYFSAILDALALLLLLMSLKQGNEKNIISAEG